MASSQSPHHPLLPPQSQSKKRDTHKSATLPACISVAYLKSLLARLFDLHYGIFRLGFGFWIAEIGAFILVLVTNVFIQMIYNTILPLYGGDGNIKSAIASAGTCLAFLFVTIPVVRVLFPAVYNAMKDGWLMDSKTPIEFPHFVASFAYVRLRSVAKVYEFLYSDTKFRRFVVVVQKTTRSVVFVVVSIVALVKGDGTLNGTLEHFFLHGLQAGAVFFGMYSLLRIVVFVIAVVSPFCCRGRSTTDGASSAVVFHLAWRTTSTSDENECDYGDGPSRSSRCWYHSKVPSLVYLVVSVVLLLFLFVSVHLSEAKPLSKAITVVFLLFSALFQFTHLLTKSSPPAKLSSLLAASGAVSVDGSVQASDDAAAAAAAAATDDDNPQLAELINNVLGYLNFSKTSCNHVQNVATSALYTWFVFICMGFVICGYATVIRDSNAKCLPIAARTPTPNATSGLRPSQCEVQWNGLDIVDLAALAKTAYLDAETKDGCVKNISAGLDRLSKYNWTLVNPKDNGGKWIHFYELFSSRLNVTVIVVRGGQSVAGVMNNLLLWSEATVLGFVSKAIPLTKSLPKDAVSTLLKIATTFEGSLDSPVRRHYVELDDYVARRREKFRGSATMLVGHSFGGGLAKISGARAGLRTIAFGAPGLGQSLRKFNVSQDQVRNSAVNVALTGDPVAAIDDEAGSVMSLDCGGKSLWTCHGIDQIMCKLQDYCSKVVIDCSSSWTNR